MEPLPTRKRFWRQRVIFLVLTLSAILVRISTAQEVVHLSSESGKTRSQKPMIHEMSPSSSSSLEEDIPSTTAMDHDHHHHHHHDDTKNNTFCNGMYMTMFTDGFRWSLGPKDSSHHHHNATSPSTCLAYYVRSWKLNASGKFRGAMVFSFLLALLTEGLSASRFVLIDYMHRLRHPLRHRKAVLTFVYALQSWLGTLIMLVAMMYSIEMLLSIVAGLMVGNYLFMREQGNKIRGTTSMTTGTFMAQQSDSLVSSGPSLQASAFARRMPNASEEERQGLLLSASPSGDVDSVEGLDSIGGLQMQTRKEE